MEQFANYSVIMSVYHRENPSFLAESLQSMVGQTKLTDDFVIVEGGELPSDLEAVISKFEKAYPSIFHVIRGWADTGLADALNLGLSKSKNEICCRMDSDDIASPSRCAKELAKINEGFGIVGSIVSEFDTDPTNITGYRRVPEETSNIRKFAKKRNPFNHPTVMYRKSIVLAAGGYPVGFRKDEDYFLFYRMINLGTKCYNFQEPLVNMRAGGNQIKRRNSDVIKYDHLLRKDMLNKHFISLANYVFITPLRDLGHSMSPSLRSFFYKHFLRKKK